MKNTLHSQAEHPETTDAASDEVKALDVSVVIVSYNTSAMTIECLQTLYRGLGDLSAAWLAPCCFKGV